MSAQLHECAEKHASGEVFTYTHRSEREVLVHHHASGLSSRVTVKVRFRKGTGLPFQRLEEDVLFLLVGDDLEFPHCQPLQKFVIAWE